MTGLEPIWVGDANDHRRWPPRNLEEIKSWVTSQGLNPNHIHRIEVYMIDGPVGRVYSHHIDEKGRVYCPLDHEHRRHLIYDECTIEREPYDVLLSSLPPALEVS
jgi:hypothetical protein